jgi:hypothetical protein
MKWRRNIGLYDPVHSVPAESHQVTRPVVGGLTGLAGKFLKADKDEATSWFAIAIIAFARVAFP